MPRIQSADETMEGAASTLGLDRHTSTKRELLATTNANGDTNSAPAEPVNGDGTTPEFDYRSAAKKLKCDNDPDAVSTAIGILLKELDDCKMKIDFFETLFGYRAEHLMAYDEHLVRHEDIKFYGQRRLQGRALQQAMLQQNGNEPSLAELRGKSVVVDVPENHYTFAVVLPMQDKKQVDRELSKRHAQNAQAAEGTAGATTEDVVIDLQKKKLSVKKAVEKDKLQKILSQGHGSTEYMPPTSPDASADSVVAHSTPTKGDAAPAEAKERKRKRAIVASDEEDDDRNAKASKLE